MYSLKALFFARWRIQIDWKWREHAWAFKISSIHYRSFTGPYSAMASMDFTVSWFYQTLFCNGFNGFISFQSLGYSWRNRICLRKVCCNEVVKAMKKNCKIQCDNHWFQVFNFWDVLFLGLNRTYQPFFNQLGSSHVTTCPVKTWSPYRQSTERAPWSPRPGRHDRAPAQFAAPHRGESSPVACTSIQGTGSRSGRSLAPPPLLLWVAVMGK